MTGDKIRVGGFAVLEKGQGDIDVFDGNIYELEIPFAQAGLSAGSWLITFRQDAFTANQQFVDRPELGNDKVVSYAAIGNAGLLGTVILEVIVGECREPSTGARMLRPDDTTELVEIPVIFDPTR